MRRGKSVISLRGNLPEAERRFNIREVRSDDYLTWGQDNAYPQAMRVYSDSSGTCSSCVKTYANFIRGRGFADENLSGLKINRRGMKLERLLRLQAKEFAHVPVLAFHINYNLAAEKVEVNHIPSEFCRLVTEDDNNYVAKIAVHKDWAQLKEKTKAIHKQDIDFIDVYNSKKEVVWAQIQAAGGIENYKGQIAFFTMSGEIEYPVSIFDAVIEDVITESMLKKFRMNNVDNNFNDIVMWELPWENETEEDDQQDIDSFKVFTGVEGDRMGVMWNADGEREIKPHIINTPDTDKKYELTNRTAKESIIEVFSMPKALIGVSDSGGVTFANDVMEDAYSYYNSMTEDERDFFSEVYREVFEGIIDNEFIIEPKKWM